MDSENSFELYPSRQQIAMPDFIEDEKLNAPALYIPSSALKNAVNVALALGKPLLLTGEPGSGKTQLAYSLAHNFGLKAPLVFNTRTTSKASDLFYKYDSLGHFQFVQSRNASISEDEIEKKFIRYQALGKAIISGERSVVLIDEIDKAPRDLPNDILNVLEELAFDVPEINKHYKVTKDKRPVIIMTSNSEKNMPDAFLRRCIYYHLSFPNEEELFRIISAKVKSDIYSSLVIQTSVIPHFMMIRSVLKRKKPGTAELLNWLTLLEKIKFPVAQIENYKYATPEAKANLAMTYNVLAKTEEDLKILQAMAGLI
jgi:MoxR-like ATPase